jgi:hypothetical protein
MMLRKRVFWPPPQATLQMPNPFQLLTAQSTGQLWILQVVEASSTGQGRPPLAGETMTVL